MKAKTLTVIMAVTALAIFASLAMAWGPGYGVPPLPNLTPEQASKIQSIREAYLKEVAPLQQQLLAKKLELRSLWLSPNPDQAKINALQKDILNLTAKIQEKSTNARLEIRKVLTPEQQAQLSVYGPFIGYGKGKKARMGWW
jgi:zinc resistance-associated protein